MEPIEGANESETHARKNKNKNATDSTDLLNNPCSNIEAVISASISAHKSLQLETFQISGNP
jgi:hypothetical protein